jgi:aerobic-type carbon monoxide dehydrogenase small subunit (CoxS/CutS family)
MAAFTLKVNGKDHTIDVPPDMPLLWVLRDILGYTGPKYGCGVGVCGSCTCHLDGTAIRTCMVTVSEVGTRKITTIEGLSPDGTHPVQKAWLAEDVAQCGYCQTGQIMGAAALLAKTPNPSDTQIDETMSDYICRCGTYQRIRKAVKRAAREK